MTELLAPHADRPDADPALNAEEQALARQLAMLQRRMPAPAFQQRITVAALRGQLQQHQTTQRAGQAQQHAQPRPGASSRWSLAMQMMLLLAVLVLSIVGTESAAAASLP